MSKYYIYSSDDNGTTYNKTPYGTFFSVEEAQSCLEFMNLVFRDKTFEISKYKIRKAKQGRPVGAKNKNKSENVENRKENNKLVDELINEINREIEENIKESIEESIDYVPLSDKEENDMMYAIHSNYTYNYNEK